MRAENQSDGEKREAERNNIDRRAPVLIYDHTEHAGQPDQNVPNHGQSGPINRTGEAHLVLASRYAPSGWRRWMLPSPASFPKT
jgi:hypothetical protein